MPDNSASSGTIRSSTKLSPGRFPKWIRPAVPFRIEEWGKSGRVRLPDWWAEAQAVIATGKPYFLRPGQDPHGTLLRGRPGLGSLATFVGANVYKPREPWMPSTYRIALEGFARTEKEAEARVAVFVKARLAERVGKSRQRANAALAVGAQAPGSATASLARSESRARKRDT
jgi:hypothetical protein